MNKKQIVEDLFHVKIIFHGKDKCFPKMIKETAAYEEWSSFITIISLKIGRRGNLIQFCIK